MLAEVGGPRAKCSAREPAAGLLLQLVPIQSIYAAPGSARSKSRAPSPRLSHRPWQPARAAAVLAALCKATNRSVGVVCQQLQRGLAAAGRDKAAAGRRPRPAGRLQQRPCWATAVSIGAAVGRMCSRHSEMVACWALATQLMCRGKQRGGCSQHRTWDIGCCLAFCR